MIFASDHANPPPPSVLKAAGMIAANVYVSGTYAQDAAHVKALRAAGIGPWPNYERSLWELVQAPNDRAAGRAAGAWGIRDAIRCGFPSNGTIWFPFSIDVDLDPTRYHEAADAFRGIQDVNHGRYLISCYGQGGLIKYLRAEGVIDQKGWLSASTGFPGYDPTSPDICVYQEIGSYIPGYSADRNIITDVHALHAWWPDNSPYRGDIVTPDDIAAVAAAVWQYGIKSPSGVVQTASDRILDLGGRAADYHTDLHGQIAALPKPPTAAQIAAALPAPAVDVNALAAQIVAQIGTDLATQVAQAIPNHVTLAAK